MSRLFRHAFFIFYFYTRLKEDHSLSATSQVSAFRLGLHSFLFPSPRGEGRGGGGQVHLLFSAATLLGRYPRVFVFLRFHLFSPPPSASLAYYSFSCRPHAYPAGDYLLLKKGAGSAERSVSHLNGFIKPFPRVLNSSIPRGIEDPYVCEWGSA